MSAEVLGRIKNLLTKVGFSDIHQAFIVYTVIAIFATLKILSGSGSLARDWSLPLLPEQYYQLFLKDFYSFYDWGGGDVAFLSASYPLTAFMAALSMIGIDGFMINKILILFVTISSGLSMYYLTRTLKARPWPSFAAGLFYMTTNNVIGRFWQGHIVWLFGYAFAPWALAVFIRSTEIDRGKSLDKKRIVLAGLIYALSWMQTHFFPMMFALLLFYSVFGNLQEVKKRIKGFIVVNVIALLIHMSWISFVTFGLVSGTHGEVASELTLNFTTEGINMLASTFLNNFRFLGYFFDIGGGMPAGYLTLMGSLSLVLVLLIPLIAASAILFRKDKIVGYFLLIIIAALLISARDSPIRDPVTWLELNSPLILFEDNFHFIFVISIGFSVLLGLATEELGKKWNWLIERYVSISLRERAEVRANKFIAAFIIVLVVLANAPFYMVLSGTGQSSPLSEDSVKTVNYIKNLHGDFRVAWLPMGSMGRSKYTTEEPVRDSLIVQSPKPAIDTDKGLWHPYYVFIAKTFESKRTQYLGKLLGETSGVKYFILRDDFISHYQYAYGLVNDQKELFEGQKGLTLEREFGDTQIFSNAEYAPVVRAGKAAIVSGDLASLISLSYYYKEVKEERLPFLFFASQLTPEDSELFEHIDTIIISNGNIEDLRFAFVPEKYRFDTGLHARSFSDPNKGWIYIGLQWWRLHWPFVTQLEPVAFTLTESRLDIPFTAEETTSYEVWAKVLLNHRGGTLDFQVDDEDILKVDTLPPASLYEIEEAMWKWVHIGSVELNSGQHQLSIVSDGEANAVGRIIIAPSPVVQQASGSLYSTFRNKHVIVISEAERYIADPTVLASRIGLTVSGGVTLTTGMPRDFSLNFTTVSNSSYSVIMRRSNPPRFESSEALYDDFERIGNWGGGDISLSTLHVNTGNFSQLYSLTINKTSGKTHIIGKAFLSPVDLRNITTACFFVYVETNSSFTSSQLNFGAMTSKGTGYAWNFYVANNKENLVKLDLTEFKDRGNITSVHFSIGDAWGTYDDKQHLNIYFDTLFFLTEPTSESDFQWHDLTEQYFAVAGSNEIRFPVRTGGMGIDLVVIESNISSKNEIPVMNISRINPTKYTLQVDASEPFFLAFYSNYHPLWKASVEQKPFEHFRGNFFANAYYVDRTGKYTITLEFAFQPIYGIGMLVGHTTIIVCAFIGVVPKYMLNKILRYLRSKRVRIKVRWAFK